MIQLGFYKKNEKTRGPSYWKLNSGILENKEYKNKINTFWKNWQEKKGKYPDPTVWWDNGKKFIQGLTKDYCTQLKETERKRLQQLQAELQTLNTQRNRDQIKINNMESKIEEIEQHNRKGAMIRSRAKLIENEEKPTKFFYTAEKPNQKKHQFSQKQKRRSKIEE